MAKEVKTEVKTREISVCPTCGGSGYAREILKPRESRLRTLRISAGLTYKDMAEKAECSIGFLQDIEHGKRRPNAKVIQAYESLVEVIAERRRKRQQ